MSVLNDKNIIVGVCGGIAAYKSAELVRLLVKEGANVQVVMTQAAQQFVGEATFQALSSNTVRSNPFDLSAEAAMGHIELARWADMIIIAPATANTIARIVHGMADNLLTCLCLAARAPLLIAPAMNQQMWANEATQMNVTTLSGRSHVTLCGPAEGQQACGDNGPGRMMEPEQLLLSCQRVLSLNDQAAVQHKAMELAGKKLLITAGPTIEDIDPVRYISNRSSGKMGYAIAKAAQAKGAKVCLVSGPVVLQSPEQVRCIRVRSAQQMYDAVFSEIRQTDVFIATAAVADYRPVNQVASKIKKSSPKMTIELMQNPDILKSVSEIKKNRPLCIGFAAETNDLESYAIKKLKQKKLDMIVANKVGESQGFDVDDNELYLYWLGKNQKQMSKKLAYASKQQLATQLIDDVVSRLLEHHESGSG